MDTAYDLIGLGYSQVRRPYHRLAVLIADAVGDARTIVNIGAGAGSYEPLNRQVAAVEPSAVMLRQHPGPARIRGTAESLPLADHSVGTAMAIMTMHHWADQLAGLEEMRRVARRQVIFTWDPRHDRELWIISEYLPQIRAIEHARFPPLEQVIRALGVHTVLTFKIPFDFTDGYQPAFWRRPAAYLDPVVRAASSTFAQLPASIVSPAMGRLRADLQSGTWARRHQDLLQADLVDYGYRLLIAG